MSDWRATLFGVGRVTLAVVLVAVTAAVCWIVAERELARVRRDHAALLAENAAVRERVARAAQAERTVHGGLAEYQRLLERRVIGAERRRDWIEAMARFKARRRLPQVKYAIEPQRVLAWPPSLPGAPGVEWRASRIELDLLLLHERDLLGFFTDLLGMAGAQALPRDCTLRRVEQAADPRDAEPRLHAHCRLDLVTIQDRDRRGGR